MIELLLEAERARASGDLDRAERLFRTVVAGDPQNAIAKVGLARVALARDETETARALLRSAAAIDPENPAAVHLLAELERRPWPGDEGLAGSDGVAPAAAEAAATAEAAPAPGPGSELAPWDEPSEPAPEPVQGPVQAPAEPAPVVSRWVRWLRRLLGS